jgi:hypothetical protein
MCGKRGDEAMTDFLWRHEERMVTGLPKAKEHFEDVRVILHHYQWIKQIPRISRI